MTTPSKPQTLSFLVNNETSLLNEAINSTPTNTKTATRENVKNPITPKTPLKYFIDQLVVLRNFELTEYEESALLLEFSKDLQETDESKVTSRGLKFYQIRIKRKWLFRCAAWCLCIMSCFQQPAWTYQSNINWKNPDLYPTSGVPSIPFPLCILLMFICLVLLSYSIFLELGYEGKKTRRYFILRLFMLVLGIKSIECFIGFITCIINIGPIVTMSPIEALSILFVEKSFSHKLISLTSIVPKFLGVITLFACAISSFTVLGFIIFNPISEEAKLYFSSYVQGVWNMLMILIGSNWPAPMIPAYEHQHWTVIYFVVFIVIFNWGLLNIILGVVYVLFDLQATEVKNKLKYITSENLDKAFKILDRNGCGNLQYEEIVPCIDMFITMFAHGNLAPSRSELFQLVKSLDANEKGFISRDDFSQVTTTCSGHALRSLRSLNYIESSNSDIESIQNSIDMFTKPLLSVSLLSRSDSSIRKHSPFKLEPKEYRSSTSSFFLKLLRLCNTLYFDIAMDSLICILCFTVVLYQLYISLILLIFFLQVIELLVKLYFKGFFSYKQSYRNLTNLILLLALASGILSLISLGTFSDGPTLFGIRFVLLFRLVIYPRNLLLTSYVSDLRKKYKNAIEYAFIGAGSFSFIFHVLIVSIYIFACFGVLFFGGDITFIGNKYQLLQEDLYGERNFWPINFNDIPSAIATIYLLLLVNDTHVVASGYSTVTSSWANLFFVIWYIFGVLFLFNILTSTFVTEFMNFLQDSSIIEFTSYSSSESDTGLDKRQDKVSSPLPPDSRFVSPLDMNHVLEGMDTRSDLRPLDVSFSMNELRNGLDSPSSFSPRLDKMNNSSKSITNLSILGNGNDLNNFTSFQRSIFASPSKRQILASKVESVFTTSPYYSKVLFSPTNHKVTNIGNTNVINSFQIGSSMTPQSFIETSNNSFYPINRLNSDEFGYVSLHDKAENMSRNSVIQWMTDEFEPYEIAAVYLQIAREGSHELPRVISSKAALVNYRIWTLYSGFVKYCAWLLITLRVFARPNWTYSDEDWHQESIYPISGIPFFSTQLSVGLRFPLVLIVFIGLYLEIQYETMDIRRTIILSGLIGYSITQLIMLIIAVALDRGELVFWSSIGEELYILWFNRRSRSKLGIFIKLLPHLFGVVTILLCVITFFASFGPYVTGNDINSSGDGNDDASNFNTFANSLWSIFTSVASSCYPDQVMSMYSKHRWTFFYFSSFITICSFGILLFLFAIILIVFQRQLINQSDERKTKRHLFLLKAFESLDTLHRGWLDAKQIKSLFHELYSYYHDFRKYGIPNEERQLMMIDMLDIDEDKKISSQDFVFILDVIRLKIRKKDQSNRFSCIGNNSFISSIIISNTFQSFQYLMNDYRISIFFDSTIVLLILINLSSATSFNLYDNTSMMNDTISIIIYLLYLIEVICKLLAIGIIDYFHIFHNKIDFLLTFILTILYLSYVILTSSTLDTSTSSSTSSRLLRPISGIQTSIKIIEYVRLLVYPRNLRYFFKEDDINTLFHIFIRLIYSLATLIVAFYYLISTFILIGILCFGGKINYSNLDLMQSNYGQSSK